MRWQPAVRRIIRITRRKWYRVETRKISPKAYYRVHRSTVATVSDAHISMESTGERKEEKKTLS